MLITWEGLLTVFVQGLTNGGPAGLVYGYLLAWIGTLAVFTTMAELVSMAPTSSGQYHWVALLAPPSCQRFLSYLTGWLTVAGWQAFVASACYLSGTLIQGLIILQHPGYHPKLWHGTFLFWAVAACAVFVNTVVSRSLPKLESLILVLHVLGFFAIFIPLIYLSPRTSASFVFRKFLNGGDWPSQGLSFFVGLLGNVFAFLVAIGVTSSIAILLSLISIGSTVALNDVLSLTVASLFLSYFACCSLLLWRRCTGGIFDRKLTSRDAANLPQSSQLSWGPFHIPGMWGVVINIIGCTFLIIVIFFSFWPPGTPVTPSTMNYSVLATGLVVIISTVYYAVCAHKVYTGPVVEVMVPVMERMNS
ncbi:MAG: hypothetical protein Q9196_005692 [Gyalolechia fulgens]